jgi:hypothetical protein
VIQNNTGFRNNEQVLVDLSKALGFSPASLEANRAGRVSGDQFNKFIGRCLGPLGTALVCGLAPFLLWAALTGTREHISFFTAFGVFIGKLLHVGEMLDERGKISTLITVGSILAGLGLAAYNLNKFSVGMYFDLLTREVVAREGRVTAREEQIIRPNGRDPIENYFFDVKTFRYDVNFAAYKALDSGCVYLMYVLPRSGILLSMEPKMTRTGPAPVPPVEQASGLPIGQA